MDIMDIKVIESECICSTKCTRDIIIEYPVANTKLLYCPY